MKDTTIHLTITTTKTMSYLTDYPGYSNFRPLYAGTPTQVVISTTTSSTSLSSASTITNPMSSSGHHVPSSSYDMSSSTSSYEASRTSAKPSATSTGVEASSSQILDSVVHYKSDDSAKLGMAIGIPVGVVVLLLVSLGTWYYFKGKRATNKTILPVAANQSYYQNSSSDSEFNDRNPYLMEYKSKSLQGSNPDLKLDMDNYGYGQKANVTPINFRSVPNRIKAESSHWFNRLSRAVKIDTTKSDDEDSGISPLFLKRFNLNKPFTPNTPKTPKQQSSRNQSTGKKLPKLPSLIQMENVKEDSRFVVVEPYTKHLDDEVTILTGDKIKVVKNYPDHWSLVKNVTSGKTGIVPKRCLQRIHYGVA